MLVDLVIAEGVVLARISAEVTHRRDARIAAALHIRGQAVADDAHAAFIAHAEIGENVVEKFL